MESFDFDLATIEIPVKIGGKSYLLREASEGVVVRYRNEVGRAASIEDGRVSGVGTAADADPFLLSLCLFEVTDKGERPVPVTTIRDWPRRVVKPLFEKLEEISEMGGPKSAADVQKQIDRLERKLAKLQEDAAKNGHAASAV